MAEIGEIGTAVSTSEPKREGDGNSADGKSFYFFTPNHIKLGTSLNLYFNVGSHLI